MKRLILSIATISLTGALLLGSGQAVAGSAPVSQQMAWHMDCVGEWANSWLHKVCPGAAISFYIRNDALICRARNARCPDNKQQGGTITMTWENKKTLIKTARYCVLYNFSPWSSPTKGKFFQKGKRPWNCQRDYFLGEQNDSGLQW